MLRYLKQLKMAQRGLLMSFLSIVVLSLAFPLLVSASDYLFDDNFNSYENGELTGQGDWLSWYDGWFVQSDIKQGEGKAIWCPTETICSNRKIGSQTPTGSIGFSLRIEKIGDVCNGGYIYFYGDPNGGLDNERIRMSWGGENCRIWLVGDEQQWNLGEIETYGEFFQIDIEWRDDTYDVRAKWEGKDWSDWHTSFRTWTYIDTVRFRPWASSGATYLDTIGQSSTFFPSRVFGISPASETEITDLETDFTFGWEELGDWDTLSVVFQNRDTGIFSNAKILETVSPSGQETLSFENFNFDRNGKYYFYAVATRWGIEVLEDMYLTGRYSYLWSDDLVSPEFWYTINIEGGTPFFEMSDFSTWYGSVSKFATPTDMFVSIAGFFEPTFNKIGEFGNRIKDYFNLSEVYSQGYEIGKTIPYFSYFVGQISLFLGGFPILKWVFVVILLLTGIFIFRLVLKFIPGLG